jgi:hypothetical protein
MKTIQAAIKALEKAKALKGEAQQRAVENVIRKLVRALANGKGGTGEDGLLP